LWGIGLSRAERQPAVQIGLAKLLADSTYGVGYLLKDRIGNVKEFIGDVRRVAEGGSTIDR